MKLTNLTVKQIVVSLRAVFGMGKAKNRFEIEQNAIFEKNQKPIDKVGN